MPQLEYTDGPVAGLPGMLVDSGVRDVISRVLSTQQLASVQLDTSTADGVYEISVNGVVVAEFAASTSTPAAVRTGLLADFAGSSAPVTMEAGGTGEIIVEGTDEDADYTIAVDGPTGDIAVSTLVPYGQQAPFGVGMCTDPRAPSATQCRLPRVSTDVTAGFLGTAMSETSQEFDQNGHSDGAAVPLVNRGRVYVISESAVSENGAVYCRYASGSGGTQLGAYRGDADTSTAALVPRARFGRATTGANQLTWIEHT